MSLPNLGNPQKAYTVTLTEPELNAQGALWGFVLGAIEQNPEFKKVSFQTDGTTIGQWWEHYGPSLRSLDRKLSALDDVDAPFVLLPLG